MNLNYVDVTIIVWSQAFNRFYRFKIREIFKVSMLEVLCCKTQQKKKYFSGAG